MNDRLRSKKTVWFYEQSCDTSISNSNGLLFPPDFPTVTSFPWPLPIQKTCTSSLVGMPITTSRLTEPGRLTVATRRASFPTPNASRIQKISLRWLMRTRLLPAAQSAAACIRAPIWCLLSGSNLQAGRSSERPRKTGKPFSVKVVRKAACEALLE